MSRLAVSSSGRRASARTRPRASARWRVVRAAFEAERAGARRPRRRAAALAGVRGHRARRAHRRGRRRGGERAAQRCRALRARRARRRRAARAGGARARAGRRAAARGGGRQRVGRGDRRGEAAAGRLRGRVVVAAREVRGRLARARADGRRAPGAVRWSLPAPAAVADARWAPGDGFLVAYRAGDALRLVAGDGTGDRRLAAVRAGVAPAWRRDATHTLAYADARGRVTVVDADTGERRWRGAPLAGVRELVWSASGERLLAVTARRLVLYGAGGTLLVSRRAAGRHARRARGLGAARDERRARPLGWALLVTERGRRARLRARVWASGRCSPASAASVRRRGRRTGAGCSCRGRPPTSGCFCPSARSRRPRRLRATAGRRTAVANIARQFAPGAERGAFPHSVSWCCP